MAEEETPKLIEPVTKEDSPMTEDLAKEEITHPEKDLPKTDEACTRVMIAVNQCSKGYPKPSITSRAAFDWIVKNLIKPCCKKRYKLLILHVQVLDEDGLKELDSVYASPSDFQHLRHEERAKGASLIQHFIQKCHDSEIECEGWIKMGDPKAVVCEEVKKKNPDMLVLGSRGLGTIQRMFVAGVSSYVTKHVDCPVITIKRDPKDIPDDPLND
jgi:nucleotide-binding universal stress UspA family protein